MFVGFGRRKEEWSKVMLKNITEARGGGDGVLIKLYELKSKIGEKMPISFGI